MIPSTALNQKLMVVDGVCARVVLIQESSAASRPTVAVQLALVVLNRELVVVRQLLSAVDLPQGKDDNVLAAVYINDTRVAVWLTGVVDEASGVALHRCVHHVKVIDAEHVATDPLKETTNNLLPLKRPFSVWGLYQNAQILQLQTENMILGCF